MPIYEYKCKKCETVQEVIHKINEENKTPCEKCGAEAKELEKQISSTCKHGSWSRWNVI